MNKHNLSSLKEKIASNPSAKLDIFDKFRKADSVLNTKEETVEHKADTQTKSKIIRKTFALPSSEVDLIEKIKQKALNRRVVLSESAVIRLGMLMASNASEDDIESLSKSLTVLAKGRPKE